MKRDMDLIRKLLLKIEENQNAMVDSSMTVDGFGKEVVEYHIKLCVGAGLLEKIGKTYFQKRTNLEVVHGYALTWSGHDFVSAARDPVRWSKTKAAVSRAGDVAFSELIKILGRYAAEQVAAAWNA